MLPQSPLLAWRDARACRSVYGLGFRVWGLGFGVVGFRVWGVGFRGVRVLGFGLGRFWGLGLRA